MAHFLRYKGWSEMELNEEELKYENWYAERFVNEQLCGTYKREMEKWLSGGGEGE